MRKPLMLRCPLSLIPVIATVRITELVFVSVGLLLYVSLLWFLQRRFLKKVNLVFSHRSCDERTVTQIKRTLDDLNLDSAHCMFTMERITNIVFRRKEITLLYGRVASRSPGG